VAHTRIPVFLVTGFLGSGKTTLLWKWLHESPVSGLRPAVVMNDFGDLSVDSLLLGRSDVPLETVSGGCVCCADDAQLGHAVRRLAVDGDRSVILVETSGLAEPDAVVDQLTDPDVAEVARLHGVFTVVDVLGFEELRSEIAEWRLAERQIQFAGVVFLSRCDLADEETVARVKKEVAVVNPAARIVRLPFALPELPDLLRQPACTQEVDPAVAATVHLHERYLSLTFALPRAVPRASFDAFLGSLDRREVVRGKGFVRLAESPDVIRVFHYVMGRHFIEALPADTAAPPASMVLIGPALDRSRLAAKIRGLSGSGSAPFVLEFG
jgi:G3E family GTPase